MIIIEISGNILWQYFVFFAWNCLLHLCLINPVVFDVMGNTKNKKLEAKMIVIGFTVELLAICIEAECLNVCFSQQQLSIYCYCVLDRSISRGNVIKIKKQKQILHHLNLRKQHSVDHGKVLLHLVEE